MSDTQKPRAWILEYDSDEMPTVIKSPPRLPRDHGDIVVVELSEYLYLLTKFANAKAALKQVKRHLDNGRTSQNDALCLIRRDVEDYISELGAQEVRE